MTEKTGRCEVCFKDIPIDDQLCDDCYVMVMMYEYSKEQEEKPS